MSNTNEQDTDRITAMCEAELVQNPESLRSIGESILQVLRAEKIVIPPNKFGVRKRQTTLPQHEYDDETLIETVADLARFALEQEGTDSQAVALRFFPAEEQAERTGKITVVLVMSMQGRIKSIKGYNDPTDAQNALEDIVFSSGEWLTPDAKDTRWRNYERQEYAFIQDGVEVA